MSLEDRYVTATPEGVSLDVALAGFGSRFGAYVLDIIILIIPYLVIVIVMGSTLTSSSETSSLVAIGLTSLLTILFFFGYFIICEMLWSGHTVGKRALGIRVVSRAGLPLTFSASLLRNIARLVDMLPVIPCPYLVGAIAIFASSKNQRLGDMMAGTLVIRERHATDRLYATTGSNATAYWSQQIHAGAGLPHAELPAALAAWDVSAVSDEEIALVRQFLARRWEYAPAARERLAASLADRLRPLVVGAGDTAQPELFLATLARVKAHRR
jgi:uncharacterized RDD family membrane protein YckC